MTSADGFSRQNDGRRTVVLVHGLWLHGAWMLPMKRQIGQRGYAVRAYSYPSVRADLQTNAERLARYCGALGHERVHLVGHSMGGIVALRAAELLPPERRGRIVVVGTPFQDTYSGRQLQRWRAGRAILGLTLTDWLGEEKMSRAQCEIGVIAGDGGRGLARLIAPALPRPHDGVVCVDETRVPDMTDHVVLQVSHTAMMFSRPVARQICAFIGTGRFERATGAGALGEVAGQ